MWGCRNSSINPTSKSSDTFLILIQILYPITGAVTVQRVIGDVLLNWSQPRSLARTLKSSESRESTSHPPSEHVTVSRIDYVSTASHGSMISQHQEAGWTPSWKIFSFPKPSLWSNAKKKFNKVSGKSTPSPLRDSAGSRSMST